MTLRIFASGGGVQSTAALILSAHGEIDYPIHVFANVGEDSENPGTLEYVNRVLKPYAAKHGIEFHEIWRTKKDGSRETILSRLYSAARSVPIPARMSNGAPGNRTCTTDFKVKLIARWLKDRGATKDNPAICGLGISMDEWHRARNDSGFAWEQLEYPLITLRLTRRSCMQIIETEGLPIPPKSSCYFCPFHNMREWQRLKREQPALFIKACEIETYINEKRHALGRDSVWLTRVGRPLAEVVGDQLTLFDDDPQEACGIWGCMT